jgi:hypothetical protein
MKTRRAMTALVAAGVAFTLAGGAQAAELDFEGLLPGTVLYTITPGLGATPDLPGPVQVFGYNPKFGANTNAAVVFDSSDNYVMPSLGSEFLDLGTPNEVFGGPGVGEGGETTNDTPLYNVLVVDKYLTDSDSDGLVDQPDDDDRLGMYFDYDFSTVKHNGKGTVTVNSVTVMDVEREEGEDGTYVVLSGPGMPPSLIAIPPTGNNGVVTIDGIGLGGVDHMRVQMNGSGAMASAIVEEGDQRPCWITTGGFHNAGVQSGSKDFTFGGNVGPPPSGSWEVNDHNTGDKFHSHDVHITSCTTVERTGPDQPGGKKGLTVNRADFEGTGRLNGVDGYPFTGYVLDGGEPAGKKGKDPDYFELIAVDPVTSAVVFAASGNLDGGNVQIHPAK